MPASTAPRSTASSSAASLNDIPRIIVLITAPLLRLFPHPDIHHLHKERECDGNIDDLLVHVLVESFEYQYRTDHQEERKRQHLNGRIIVDEITHFTGEQDHDHHGNDDRKDHDEQVHHQSHRGKNGIKGEYDIDENDLQDNGVEADLLHAHGFVVIAHYFVMQFHGRFIKQEHASGKKDQVAA